MHNELRLWKKIFDYVFLLLVLLASFIVQLHPLQYYEIRCTKQFVYFCAIIILYIRMSMLLLRNIQKCFF